MMGKRRTRIPVACQTALATAPAVPVMPISPTPLMPRAFTWGSCSSIVSASSDGTSAFNLDVILREVGVHRPTGTPVHDGILMERERHAPDHAAQELAAHEMRVDDPPRGEDADDTRDADLTEIGIDLDLGEDRAVRMHGIGGLRRRIRGTLAACFDLPPARRGRESRL